MVSVRNVHFPRDYNTCYLKMVYLLLISQIFQNSYLALTNRKKSTFWDTWGVWFVSSHATGRCNRYNLECWVKIKWNWREIATINRLSNDLLKVLHNNSPCQCNIVVCTVHTTILHWPGKSYVYIWHHFFIFNFITICE